LVAAATSVIIVKSPPDSYFTDNLRQEACPTSSQNISGGHWRYCLQCGHELINDKQQAALSALPLFHELLGFRFRVLNCLTQGAQRTPWEN
jgi:hypothetical protein